MIKNLTGGALISYGSAFPPESEAYDGALFYKNAGADQGLYIFSYNADSNLSLVGDQVSQSWSAVVNPGLFVVKTGDKMSGPLEITGLSAFSQPFGMLSISMPADKNYSYISLSRNGYTGWSIGVDTSQRFIVGLAPSSATTVVPENVMTLEYGGRMQLGGNTVWHAGNDGPGSGLDADTLDGYDSSYFLSAIAGAGPSFVSVQQGGGAGQGNNKVYIGYTGSALGLQVDSTNFGSTWPININGSAASANTANTANSATNATSAQFVRARGAFNGSNMTFFPDAGSGAPTYVWGTNDGVNAYMYPPGSLPAGSVVNAENAQVANQLRQNGSGTPMTFNYQGQSGTPTYVWGTNDGVNSYVWNPANFTVSWSNVTGAPNFGNYIDRTTDTWKTSLDGINRFFFGSNGTTYFSASAGFDFRNQAGSSLMTVSNTGAIIAAGDVTAFSDARLKKDIQKIEDALDKVDQLNGVLFTRKSNDERGTGLIAQEVQAVLPEAVHTSDEGFLSVAYGNLVGLLVEAIKELRAEVKDLKAKV